MCSTAIKSCPISLLSDFDFTQHKTKSNISNSPGPKEQSVWKVGIGKRNFLKKKLVSMGVKWTIYSDPMKK